MVKTAEAPKKSHSRTRIDAQGRILIPAELRRELGMKPGELIAVDIVDGELRIVSLRAAIRRAQELVTSRTKGRSLVDELIAERREEAARE